MSEPLQISVVLSSIQDLPQSEGVTWEDLFVVSHPDPNEEGGYVSRKMTFGEMVEFLNDNYHLSSAGAILSSLSSINEPVNISVDIESPYVISAMQFRNGIPVSAWGYRLSDMMNVVPEIQHYDSVKVATMYFGGTSSEIAIPVPKALVTFVRWEISSAGIQ